MSYEKRGSSSVTIYDIAQMAHVSPTTVSKVINGRYGVSEKTYKKVQEIVTASGFMPKISVNNTNYIAIVYSNQKSDMFESPFTHKILKGADNAIHSSDYYMTLIPLKSLPETREEFTVFCHRQGIAGCIFVNIMPGEESRKVVQISGVIPFVIINARCPDAPNMFSVISNDYFGAYRAVSYMIECGHRRIAMATIPGSLHEAHEMRQDAYQMALKSYGIVNPDSYIFNAASLSYEDFEKIEKNWEQNGIVPTAIFCLDDGFAMTLIRYLQHMGKRVPEDISLIGFDDYDYDTIIMPNLTTVRQKLLEKGQRAVEIIIEVLAGRLQCTEDTRNQVFETELVIRDSVRRL